MNDLPEPESPAPADDKSTGLPLLRTWPAVYAFVLAVFVLLVILLAIFTSTYGPNPLEALWRALHVRPAA